MRYLKITLSGAALFLVYLWISVLLNSCNSNKPEANPNTDSVEILEEELEGSDFTSDEFEGGDSDEFEGKPMGDEDMSRTSDSESNDFTEDEDYIPGDYTASKEKTTLQPRSKTKTFTPDNSSSSSSSGNSSSNSGSSTYASSGSSSGSYMVIAGSYLLEENANNMVQKLKNMGYSNAEIVYFNQSQYHSICAGRYDSNGSASSTASSLRNAGIDSYVHKRQ